ncbi:MAG: hypothetical protein HC836_30905 [Richelia sp. RM2_1_2]|nr:hypothetical protein [Richelia sp. RM1_1_1]NJO62477.1 hypothetical protein [Richelia sp. RM2_1_2]
MNTILAQIEKIKKLSQNIYASTFIKWEARFIWFFSIGIMIAYVMSFPLGLLPIFHSLIPIIWNAGWRLWLIWWCLILVAIFLESWFHSDKNDKDS